MNEAIYHVFNKGITDQLAFSEDMDYLRFVDTMRYYQYLSPPLRYSIFVEQPGWKKSEFFKMLKFDSRKLVSIFSFCLMPNHFHLLLRQNIEKGISTFMGKLTDSFTRFFNTKNKRRGPIFQGRFKAVPVVSESQLVHVERYIHLNPYSAGLVKDRSELEHYPYSSLPEYLGGGEGICERDLILNLFKDRQAFGDFTFDYADVQRKLELMKHLILE